MKKNYLLLFIFFISIFTIFCKKSHAHLYLQTDIGYNKMYGNFNHPSENSLFIPINNKHISNLQFGATAGYNLNKYINIYSGWHYLNSTTFSKTILENNNTIVQDYSYSYKSNYFFIGMQTSPQLYKKLYANLGISLGGLYNKYNFYYYKTSMDKPINSIQELYNSKKTKILLTTSLDLGLEFKATSNLSLLTNYSYIYSLNKYNSHHYKINNFNFGIKIYFF